MDIDSFAGFSRMNSAETAELRQLLENKEVVALAQKIADACFIPLESAPAPEYPEGKMLDQAWFAAAYLSSDAAVEHYKRLNIPAEVLYETMTDMPLWLRNTLRNNGYIGLAMGKSWTAALYRGKVTRHGRLECNTEHLFKHAPLQDANGNVLLETNAPVINLHIPEDGPMDMASCSESVKKMSRFFAEYFPDYNWQGLLCESWLLDTQLKSMLPSDSNIVKFQNLGVHYPLGESPGTIFRIFGSADPQKIANPTRLQSRAAEFLKQGGKFLAEGIFIPRSKLEAVDFDLEKLQIPSL